MLETKKTRQKQTLVAGTPLINAAVDKYMPTKPWERGRGWSEQLCNQRVYKPWQEPESQLEGALCRNDEVEG